MVILIKRLKLIVFFLIFPTSFSLGWGSFAHKQINRHAVFTLPPAMFAFYKKHIHFITENSVNPDKRRYVVENEAPRHYIDLEHYSESVPWEMAPYWSQATNAYPQDELMQYGILPWHICRMKHALTKAFRKKDVNKILRLSADIGHYIADANVPLHTSKNYDGQLTGQEGIHELWETRLPELFTNNYNLSTGRATYVNNPQKRAWQAIIAAHKAVKDVLRIEKKLSDDFPATQKYSFEQKGSVLQKVHSSAYAQAYHTRLDGQVERQMNASIKMVGDFWLTCWVDAGQPDLDALLRVPLRQVKLQEDFSE
ncbi:MAG: zinc dependent phospholipase C family protein [Bacteroidota bacterium]